MRFLLVDGISDFKKNESITAIKNISLSDDFLVNHPVYGPMMPYSLLIESVAQAGGWLITASLDFKKRALLLTLNTLKFLGVVHPGDQLIIEVELESLREDSGVIKGRARVGTTIVAHASYGIFALVDSNQLDDPNRIKNLFYLLQGRAYSNE